MGSEIDVIQCYGGATVALWIGSVGSHSHLAQGIKEKIHKLFLCKQLGAKYSTSYFVMLLEIGAWPMELSAMQRVYKYVTKVKNMPDHKLPKKVGTLDV